MTAPKQSSAIKKIMWGLVLPVVGFVLGLVISKDVTWREWETKTTLANTEQLARHESTQAATQYVTKCDVLEIKTAVLDKMDSAFKEADSKVNAHYQVIATRQEGFTITLEKITNNQSAMADKLKDLITWKEHMENSNQRMK